MVEQINLEEIKLKLVDKLKLSGWSTVLRGFLQSTEFDNILDTLYKNRQDGKRFTPPLKHVFRAFEECPHDKLKVVIVGQDPYPHFGVADGLAFSCGNTNKPQPSLQKIFEAIEYSVFEQFPSYQDPDLTRWANQGILLINSALTCEVDKVGSHYNIWKDFISYLMDILNYGQSGLIFVLMGKQAQEVESLIGSHHTIIKTTHPASASYTKTPWEYGNVFLDINKIIKAQYGPEFQINW